MASGDQNNRSFTFDEGKMAQKIQCLLCVVCEDILFPPIGLCNSGHSICKKCRINLTLCPVCDKEFSGARNFALESIVLTSYFKCKFTVDGCKELVKGDSYEKHLSDCSFRDVPCFETHEKPCEGQLIRFKDYYKHLRTEHKIIEFRNNITLTIVDSSGIADIADNAIFRVQSTKRHGEIFFCNTRIIDSVFYIWISILESEKAREYKAKIKFNVSNSNSQPKLSWTNEVYSFRDEFEDLRKNKLSFALPKNLLIKYFVKEKRKDKTLLSFSYSIRIFKCKP